MRRTEAFALAALLCSLVSACTQAGQPAASRADATAATPSVATSPGPAPGITTTAGTDRSAEADLVAARLVILDYYAAIDARDYARAYASWSDEGSASGQSFANFRDGYASTASVHATVGEPYGAEGAAGSRYIQVPVELYARQRNGSEKRYRGNFTLHAVMADGASEEQRRWHLASADLQRVVD